MTSWIVLVRIISQIREPGGGRLHHRHPAGASSPCCPRSAWPTPRPRWWARTWARRSQIAPSRPSGQRARSERSSWARSVWSSSPPHRRSSASSPTTRWCSATASAGLRIISAGFAFYAYGMTFTQSLNGAGEHLGAHLAQWPVLLGVRAAAGLDSRSPCRARRPPARTSPASPPSALLAVASGAVFRRGAWKPSPSEPRVRAGRVLGVKKNPPPRWPDTAPPATRGRA